MKPQTITFMFLVTDDGAELVSVSQPGKSSGHPVIPEREWPEFPEKAAANLKMRRKPTLEERVAELERLHGMEAR